jgi:hypothetical protein
MSETFNPAQKLFEFWADVATKVAAAGMAANGDAAPTQSAREVRSTVFEAMGRYADQFMRSPQFLEFTRHSLDGSMQLREQLNDFLTKLRHELQGVARQDIESVLAAVHQMERRVIERLDDIDKKIDELHRRLGRAEKTARAREDRAGAQTPRRRK